MAYIAGRNPYLVALDDPNFCARLDRRIAAESIVDPETGCRIWMGGKTTGYGVIDFRSTTLIVHRLIAIRAGRAAPEDPESLHSCDTRACIEPAHLSGGTRVQNVRDATMRNRYALGKSGFRGVILDPHPYRKKNPWRAQVAVAGKTYHMGYFADPERAAARVIGARKCLGLVQPGSC